MNSYTTTQGTVKVVNPETNGTVRPQSSAYVVYKGEKVYVTVERYYKLNNRSYADVKAVQGRPFNINDAETYGNGMYRKERTAFIYTETKDAPHPVNEAYALEKAIAEVLDPEMIDAELDGCGNDTEDLLASMRG